jgi:two-component system, NarL family, nitrate/nitrite response regulator NarL
MGAVMDGMPKAEGAGPGCWPESGRCRTAQTGGIEDAQCNLLILSDIRFLCEGLAAVLARDRAFVVGVAATIDDALAVMAVRPSPIILVDAALPDGRAAVTRLRQLAPAAQIVALALSETEADVIAWAEAGVCGYVPRNTPLDELANFLGKIMRREQVCSSRIAASLLRWIAEMRPTGAKAATADAAALTAREDQIMHLVAAGLSNKEIARRLDIGLATVKSHVHNLLGKLALERRSQVAQWMRVHQPQFRGTGEMAHQPAEHPEWMAGARAAGPFLSPSSLGQEMDCPPTRAGPACPETGPEGQERQWLASVP